MASPHAQGLTSVVIVTADSGPLASACVARVLDSTVPVEVLVVDNASRDGEPARIAAAHAGDARVRVVENGANLGFGTACNRGAALARGDALVFLNPDGLVEPDSLAGFRAAAAHDPGIGLAGAHVRDAAGRPERAIRRRDPTLRRALATLFDREGDDGVEMPPFAGGDAPEPVDAVSGACLFVTREAWERVGGFDEGYFLHCEDLDLCRRVRDAGRAVVFVPGVRVRHEQGSSSRSRPVFVARHKHHGMWRWFRRFDPAARNVVVRVVVWCGLWAHFALVAPRLFLRGIRARRSR
ncbi:glycosyltransferase family 2 protein [Dokdonella sp. MW10]|uniref:glycosyltransferase family 2 protein n=1 Tax=Dokdonella sp. MW10 TaxID=2992926 RepID=UPI003F7E1F5F